jgi:hypothetical protein
MATIPQANYTDRATATAEEATADYREQMV